MTTTHRPSERRGAIFRDSERGQFARFPTAVSLAEISLMLAISALVDLADEGDLTLRFLAAALLTGAVAAVELKRVPRPRVRSPGAVFTMATLSWVVLIGGAAGVHLLADATDQVDTALLEGAATATTTAMTSLDLDSQPMGLLLFRAMTQWLGGMGGLIVALVVIPLVFGAREVGRGRLARDAAGLLAGGHRGYARIVAIYAALTMLMVVLFTAAGMGAFDASVHAMATASTGGLGTHTSSLAAFDSAAIEWVAVLGMVVAGLHFGVIWWAIKRQFDQLARQTELWTYLATFVFVTACLALWLQDDSTSAIRTAAVQVASAMSTTGFVSTPWLGLDNGAQTLLFTLVGIGAMAGAAGGGFRYLRVIELLGFARRELKRQLHPTVVAVVRVGGRSVPERTLDRANSYMVLAVLIGAVGAALIALGDSAVSVTGAISLSVSAVSTAGPHLHDGPLGDLSGLSKVTLSSLMLLGRLSLYAVILTVLTVAVRLFQWVDGLRSSGGRR